MRLELEHVLSEKFAVSTILFLRRKKIIYKFDLRAVTKSTRQIDRLVKDLDSAGLIYISDISNRNRRMYRISLTDEGRAIAQNLETIEIIEEEKPSGISLEPRYEMLIEIHSLKIQSLSELSHIRDFDEAKELLIWMNEKKLIEIEKYPSGAPNLSSPVSFKITARGEAVANELIPLKNLLNDSYAAGNQ